MTLFACKRLILVLYPNSQHFSLPSALVFLLNQKLDITMSSASGVEVEQACIDEFSKIKMGKQYKFVIYRVSDDKKRIIVETVGKKANQGQSTTEPEFAEFSQMLPADDCRYAVYDFSYPGIESQVKDKLLFLSWCPDTAPIKSKMLYASSKDGLKKKLEGALKEVQCNDTSDLSFGNILEACVRGEKM